MKKQDRYDHAVPNLTAASHLVYHAAQNAVTAFCAA